MMQKLSKKAKLKEEVRRHRRRRRRRRRHRMLPSPRTPLPSFAINNYSETAKVSLPLHCDSGQRPFKKEF